MEYSKNEIKRANFKPKSHVWICPLNNKYELSIPNTVYPPREDTNLLAETLMTFGKVNGKKLLEIGCGTGVVSIFAKTCGWEVTGCDINPLAIATSRGIAEKYNIKNIEFIEGGIEPKFEQAYNLFEGGPFDLIVWNLPYLEKPKKHELLGPLEDASLADISEGEKGRLHELLIKKIEKEKSLKKDGKVILIHNDQGTCRRLSSDCMKLGWASRIINNKILQDGENLIATCIWKPWELSEKIMLDEIDSTNSYSLNKKLPIGTLVIAKKQTKGRGQRKNEWVHHSGGWCGTWTIPLGDLSPSIIQAKAGLAVLDSIASINSQELPTFDSISMAEFSINNIFLKWPNDILFKNKKLAGILSEAKTQGNETICVVGIGFNLNGTKNELGENIPDATTLEKITNQHFEPDKWGKILHASIASKFERRNDIKMIDKSKTMRDWWLSMEEFNKTNVAIINSMKYHVCSLKEDGSLGLISIEGAEIICEDSFDISWEQKSFD
ncbi:MAG: Bifunctional ligase/repressor BirA [Methanobacteriota archaeon]|nr:MAG: Bifunctional ligase/repressor BirA [Euryarchaeota archaeon]